MRFRSQGKIVSQKKEQVNSPDASEKSGEHGGKMWRHTTQITPLERTCAWEHIRQPPAGGASRITSVSGKGHSSWGALSQ